MIEVNFRNSVGVYIETLNGWLSEAGISPMSATDRERVISWIVAGLEAMGRVKRVERSNWNSNPKRSESLRRFAERLRRTRVENAENVASSRSSLGILGKRSPKPSACWRFWRMVHPSILAPGRKSYRDAPVLSRGISFNRLDGPDRLLLARSGQAGRCSGPWLRHSRDTRSGETAAVRPPQPPRLCVGGDCSCESLVQGDRAAGQRGLRTAVWRQV